ncbi:MAG: hypothetical protein EXR81_01260 [Gammaproteobacteria bacterium]|nr:hypothetical protein [Gammaproteobacteria bacterium]
MPFNFFEYPAHIRLNRNYACAGCRTPIDHKMVGAQRYNPTPAYDPLTPLQPYMGDFREYFPTTQFVSDPSQEHSIPSCTIKEIARFDLITSEIFRDSNHLLVYISVLRPGSSTPLSAFWHTACVMKKMMDERARSPSVSAGTAATQKRSGTFSNIFRKRSATDSLSTSPTVEATAAENILLFFFDAPPPSTSVVAPSHLASPPMLPMGARRSTAPASSCSNFYPQLDLDPPPRLSTLFSPPSFPEVQSSFSFQHPQSHSDSPDEGSDIIFHPVEPTAPFDAAYAAESIYSEPKLANAPNCPYCSKPVTHDFMQTAPSQFRNPTQESIALNFPYTLPHPSYTLLALTAATFPQNALGIVCPAGSIRASEFGTKLAIEGTVTDTYYGNDIIMAIESGKSIQWMHTLCLFKRTSTHIGRHRPNVVYASLASVTHASITSPSYTSIVRIFQNAAPVRSTAVNYESDVVYAALDFRNH